MFKLILSVRYEYMDKKILVMDEYLDYIMAQINKQWIENKFIKKIKQTDLSQEWSHHISFINPRKTKQPTIELYLEDFVLCFSLAYL